MPTHIGIRELCHRMSGVKIDRDASRQIPVAVRNQRRRQRLVAQLPNRFPRDDRWLAGGRTDYERTVACKRRREVRGVSKQGWVIRRHEFRGSRPSDGFLVPKATWCLAAVLLASMSLHARGQVVTPIGSPAAPPWNSLAVFEPVPFAQLWANDAGEPLAPEDTPVKTRQHPGYESVGIRAGAWMFNPSVTAGVSHDNNVFASNSDRRSDISATIQPSLGVSSLWDRHALDIQGSVRKTVYREFSELDQTDANLRLRGRIDLSHDAAILTNFRLAYLHEGVGSLTSPTGAVEPTPYSFTSADVAYWKKLGRLAGSLGIRTDSYNYGSTRARDGSIISQDSRDGRINAVHGRLDYAISGKFGIFSALEINQRNLQGTPTQSLSSDGYRSLSGINVQLGHLLSAEFGAGYASQRFDDPTIGTIQGPTYRAMLTWSATRKLDLHFKAERIVTQAADTVVGGVRADALQLGADYELRRDLVLSASATYERDKFFGQTRHDDVFSTLAALKFLVNRYSSISIQHQYVRRDSSVPTSSYDKHEVGINVTAHY